jgi:hypothetical protein
MTPHSSRRRLRLAGERCIIECNPTPALLGRGVNNRESCRYAPAVCFSFVQMGCLTGRM